eukprot:Awhi_evm1s2350
MNCLKDDYFFYFPRYNNSNYNNINNNYNNSSNNNNSNSICNNSNGSGDMKKKKSTTTAQSQTKTKLDIETFLRECNSVNFIHQRDSDLFYLHKREPSASASASASTTATPAANINATTADQPSKDPLLRELEILEKGEKLFSKLIDLNLIS